MLDLNFIPENNQTGFCLLQFIPIQLVENIIAEDHNTLNIDTIVLKNNNKMFNLYYQKNNVETSIETDVSIASSLLNYTINGFYPKNIDDERKKINYIKELQFIVLFKEKNNNVYVMGSLDNPCVFEFNYINKQEQKGYEFSIKHINKDIPSIYKGIFPI
jgi:hypothetical protein